MNNILVPVDFSRCSLKAADVAVDIALKTNAAVYFLHLHTDDRESHVPQRTPDSQTTDERGVAIVRARAEMASLVSKAEKAGVRRATPLLVFTNAPEWIETYVEAYAIDLVIMGSHGTSELKQRLIGSTALEFVRHTEAVPVLIIKERDNDKEFNLRKIVFASDFKSDWIRPFETIAELAAIYEATIELLYVVTPYHFIGTRQVYGDMKRFMHQFKRINYTPHVYNAMNEEIGIEEFVEEHQADLIAMTTRGRSGLMKIFLPSIAEGVFKHEQVPLLMINVKSLT